MKKELEQKLQTAFPLIYADMYGNPAETCLYFGIQCGDGWYDLIYNLSSKLEAVISKLQIVNCRCGDHKDRHQGNGKCSEIHIWKDTTKWCECWRFRSDHPRLAQVKEKFGCLRVYMTHYSDETSKLINEAAKLSASTCETCGKPGQLKGDDWIYTACEEHTKSVEKTDINEI